MKQIIVTVRTFLSILLCPRLYKQGLLTVMAGYLRNGGDESSAVMLEKMSDKLNEFRKKGTGKKCVQVRVTCECGESSLAESGADLTRSGWACRDLVHHVPPTQN